VCPPAPRVAHRRLLEAMDALSVRLNRRRV
jgi:hypothetical protein